jgi:very-short-patch-repair endonuclease
MTGIAASQPPDTPDRRIRRIAALQHGVVERSQLLQAGLTHRMIDRRVATGGLEPIQRGLYRYGAAPTALEPLAAAVLSVGPSAAISYRTAGCYWQLLERSGRTTIIEVSAPRGYRPPHRGVRVHRVNTLHANEVCEQNGIRFTTPARTLLDLAAVVPQHLEQALATALRRRLVTKKSLAELGRRHRGLRGVRVLRGLLEQGDDPAFTRSAAEERTLRLLRRAALPEPETNVMVNGFEVDLLWRRERLVVDLDGFAYHGSRASFEGDRRRDALLVSAGYRVIRVTWRQLTSEPEAVLVALTRALWTPVAPELTANLRPDTVGAVALAPR